MMIHTKLKVCPICKTQPERITDFLGRPGGHGYPGHSSYKYVCTLCKLTKGQSYDDIYNPIEVAIEKAKQSWNSECSRIASYLNKN